MISSFEELVFLYLSSIQRIQGGGDGLPEDKIIGITSAIIDGEPTYVVTIKSAWVEERETINVATRELLVFLANRKNE